MEGRSRVRRGEGEGEGARDSTTSIVRRGGLPKRGLLERALGGDDPRGGITYRPRRRRSAPAPASTPIPSSPTQSILTSILLALIITLTLTPPTSASLSPSLPPALHRRADPPSFLCADPLALPCPSSNLCCPKSHTCHASTCCPTLDPPILDPATNKQCTSPGALLPGVCPAGQIDCSITLGSGGGGGGGGGRGCCPGGWDCYLSSSSGTTMCRPTARLCEEGWALCPPPSSSPSQQQSLGCCPSGAECVDPSKSNNSGNGDDNLPEEEEGYTLNSGLCRVPKSYRTCAIPGWKECNIKGLEGVCCPREGGWRCALEAKDGTGCVLGNETATGPKTTTTTKITGGSQGILPTPIDTRGAIPTSGGGRARGGGWRSLEVVVVVIGLSIVFAVGGGRIW